MEHPPPPVELMQQNAAKAEAMLKLLANAKRLMILCHLLKSPLCVGELAELVGLSQSALSQHLAKLRHLGMVDTDKQGQMVYYRLSNEEVKALLSTLYDIYCNND